MKIIALGLLGVATFYGQIPAPAPRTGTGIPVGRDACASVGEPFFQSDGLTGAKEWSCAATGNPGTWEIKGNAVNALSYGAVPDSTTDSYTAIQNAITDACGRVSGHQGASLYFPSSSGTYRYSKVPVVTCSNLRIYGDRSSSTLSPIYGYGPPLAVHPPIGSGYIAVPTQTALATGAGSAMTFASTNQYWLNLSDALSVNGLTALTVEFYTNMTAVNHDASWVSSWGKRSTYDAATSAFSVNLSNGGNWNGQLNVGGTTFTLNGLGTLSTSTTYHIALSYDGSNIRLFLNGVLQATQAATGTVTQAIAEEITVGPKMSQWLNQGVFSGAIDGAIDSLHISKVARYTAGFTNPAAKFTANSNTLVLLNFDNQYDVFTVGAVNGPGVGHFMLRYVLNNGAITNNQFVNLQFNNGSNNMGPMVQKSNASKWENIEVVGGRGGLWLQNNCYESIINFYKFTGATNTIYALAATTASGVLDVYRPHIDGGPYQFVSAGDNSVNVTSGWFQTESNTIMSILIAGQGSPAVQTNLANNIINTESGGSSMVVPVVLSNALGVATLTGNYIEATATIPALRVAGGGQINIIGGSFMGSTSTTANINIQSVPASPITITGVQRTSPIAIPWSDNMASSVISLTPTFPLAPANGGAGLMTSAAFGLRFFGDGNEGAYSCNTACTLSGEHYYSSVNIGASGVVNNAAANRGLVIRSTGACVVAGQLNSSHVTGASSGNTLSNGDFGGSGGGGGGGAAAGTTGGTSSLYGALGGVTTAAGGTAGTLSGGAGSVGTAAVPAFYNAVLSVLPSISLGGAAGGAGGSSGGAGGRGGSALILVCPSINFTGSMSVAGDVGASAAANNTGAGGGGGGGYVVLSAQIYTANTGTITATGGAGGTCGAFTGCGAGAAGGNGWSKTLTIQ